MIHLKSFPINGPSMDGIYIQICAVSDRQIDEERKHAEFVIVITYNRSLRHLCIAENASSAPHKTTTRQLKHVFLADNMSYTDSMFLDIFALSCPPAECDGLWIKSSEPNSNCRHLSSRGHPLWVTSCEEMFPAAHEFIMHSQTPPPGAAEIPTLADMLMLVSAIYLDLPAASQGNSYSIEDG